MTVMVQVMIMQREGWTCTFDSHQVSFCSAQCSRLKRAVKILAKRGAAQANGTGNSASSRFRFTPS